MRVCVIAEYYPGPHDPTKGIWAHRQAVAATDHGAEVRVVALHRPIPPLAAVRDPRRLWEWMATERRRTAGTTVEGIPVEHVTFVAPPRPWSYGSWGRWAAPAVGRALTRLHATWPIDLVHAHYAVPAARAASSFVRDHQLPMVVSVHGGDVVHTAKRSPGAARAVREALAQARLVLTNSAWTSRQVEALGVDGARIEVVHLGATVPADPPEPRRRPTVSVLGDLVARKRHADVVHAVHRLQEVVPGARLLIVGDGPERGRLLALARSLGIEDRVHFCGRLEHQDALRQVASSHVMALPSIDEAFGVSYIEAMAAGVPAIGVRGEGGPEEIAARGGGLVLVPACDPETLASVLGEMFVVPGRRERLAAAARDTARTHFSWDRCGAETVRAYEQALATT
ncbi:MAG: glycosyltransferase [Solirubrobacterales bacterium]